jgi:hypothetical protein
VVIEQACQAAKLWPGIKVAINVSPVQLRDPSFADEILAIVEAHGLSPTQFELELTEGILVNNPTIAKRKLALLKSMGLLRSTTAPAFPRYPAVSSSFSGRPPFIRILGSTLRRTPSSSRWSRWATP